LLKLLNFYNLLFATRFDREARRACYVLRDMCYIISPNISQKSYFLIKKA